MLVETELMVILLRAVAALEQQVQVLMVLA
jgi:hypothetical protein